MKKILVLAMTMGLVMALGGAAMAMDNTLTVSAKVTGTCRFSSATSSLAFGTLDPSSSADVPATTTIQFWCTKGVTETITAGNGLHYSNPNRQMAGPGGDLIPYSLTLNPPGGSNVGPGTLRDLKIDGKVVNADYIAKTAGDYSDTVTLSITP